MPFLLIFLMMMLYLNFTYTCLVSFSFQSVLQVSFSLFIHGIFSTPLHVQYSVMSLCGQILLLYWKHVPICVLQTRFKTICSHWQCSMVNQNLEVARSIYFCIQVLSYPLYNLILDQSFHTLTCPVCTLAHSQNQIYVYL